MPDWLPTAWILCGIAAGGGLLLGSLIFDELITLRGVLIALLLLAMGPIGFCCLCFALFARLKDDDIVLYRRKKEPPQ